MANGIEITITNNSGKIGEELEAAILRALEQCGEQAEKYAKQLAPVDTGLLRNSITHAIDGQAAAIQTYHADKGSNRTKTGKRKSAKAKDAGSVGFGMYSGTAPKEEGNGRRAVYVGTNQEYAIYQELGTGIHATGGGGRPTPWVYQDAEGNYHTTSGNKPKPFIKPAVADHLEDYRKIIRSELEG